MKLTKEIPFQIIHSVCEYTEEAKRAKHRTKRWTEWVSKKHEFRDDSWDEPPVKQKPEDDEKFVAYENNGDFTRERLYNSDNYLYHAYKNKAGYTATEVACGWAGAIFEVTRPFGQEQ